MADVSQPRLGKTKFNQLRGKAIALGISGSLLLSVDVPATVVAARDRLSSTTKEAVTRFA